MVNLALIISSLIVLLDNKAIIEELFSLGKIRRRNVQIIIEIIKHYIVLWECLAEECRNRSSRSCWTVTRHQTFWEKDCQLNSDSFFRNNFRMSRKSFDKLCTALKHLTKVDTNMREAIPLQKRVAIGLYALGSSSEYRSIANMFGVGKATVCKILNEFCVEVWKCLSPTYLQNFPLSAERITEYVAGFEAMGYPQCLGAIDGCHIEVHPASEDAVDYFNYKGWYSTVLLALVDARYRFIYINVGTPGRCNDSQMFECSMLKKYLDECVLLKEMARPIGGVQVPVHLIGDSAFRFSTLMMKPYPFKTAQNPAEKIFNYHLSKCRRVVENAFGHLKARFRRIGKGVDNNIENATQVVMACCVLHNFLNEENDAISRSWLQSQEEHDATRQFPDNVTRIGDRESSAEEIRAGLSVHFQTLGREVDGDGEGDPAVYVAGEEVSPVVDGAGERGPDVDGAGERGPADDGAGEKGPKTYAAGAGDPAVDGAGESSSSAVMVSYVPTEALPKASLS